MAPGDVRAFRDIAPQLDSIGEQGMAQDAREISRVIWLRRVPTGRALGDCLVVRTARKPHRCIRAERITDLPICERDIPPGGRYLEYLGETPAYQGGSAYCLPCAARTWAATIDEEISRDSAQAEAVG